MMFWFKVSLSMRACLGRNFYGKSGPLLASYFIRETARDLAVHLRHSVGHDGSVLIGLQYVPRAVSIALSSIHFRLFLCDPQVNA